jgi:hypothetical protein
LELRSGSGTSSTLIESGASWPRRFFIISAISAGDSRMTEMANAAM